MADGSPIGLLLTLTYATAVVMPSQTIAIILNTEGKDLQLSTDSNNVILNTGAASGIIENEVTN